LSALRPPRSVLIVRLSSIGDVIHTLPAFCAVRDAWPEARLGWAVEPAAATLVRALPGPLAVHVVDTSAWRRRAWRPSTWRSIRDARNELRAADYELALDFQGLIKSALVARVSGARVHGLAAADAREPLAVRWYHRTAPAAESDGHIIDRSLGVARSAGASIPAVRFPELAGKHDFAYVDAQLARQHTRAFIVMHGAANWPSKQWPATRQAAAGRELYRRTGLPVLWVWGPGEEPLARRTAAAAGEGNVIAFPTTLTQLAALLSRARLFIGGDSAPLHLAVACRTPTVAVFGPTSPRQLGPIAADDIAVTRLQPCSFCHQRRCPLGTRACLETLSAAEVVAAAEQRLAVARAHTG
jgi:lipopolysaccharide heptosyltransferase I